MELKEYIQTVKTKEMIALEDRIIQARQRIQFLVSHPSLSLSLSLCVSLSLSLSLSCLFILVSHLSVSLSLSVFVCTCRYHTPLFQSLTFISIKRHLTGTIGWQRFSKSMMKSSSSHRKKQKKDSRSASFN